VQSCNICRKVSKHIHNYYEFSYCICGCQRSFPKYDKWGRTKNFIQGHQFIGKVFTEEHKKKLSLKQYNENHNMWKGDHVGNTCLHRWVKRHFWITQLCQLCFKVPPYDLANITGVYNREFKNWRYYCRKCHMLSDGRLVKLLEIKRHATMS